MPETYYVITKHDTDIMWVKESPDSKDYVPKTTRLHIKNREFPTLEEARKYKDTIHPSWSPRIAVEVE